MSQTTLERGDLAVVAVNTLYHNCTGSGNVDRVSFICFKDITTNTVIDFTDNGWERTIANRWGDTEGAQRATRTGGVIPAGTIISWILDNAGSVTAVAPDNAWSFANINLPGALTSINMNAGGDQIYFMQGGTWNNNGGTGGNDAIYDGRILYGFNTRSVWMADGTTQQSNLHPDVTPCFHMQPTGGTTDYTAYSGPTGPFTQIEWIAQIGDPNNWTTFPDCPSYMEPPSPFVILPSGMSVECTVCTGCAPFVETLLFNLPPSGGPYNITYSDGTNTFVINGATDGHLQSHDITADVTFTIVEVTDVNGCPVYSNFDGEAEVTASSGPDPGMDGSVNLCLNDGAVDLFTLIPGTPDPGGNWFPALASGTGMFDPAVDAAGPYTYNLTGAGCPVASSELDVFVTDLSASDITIDCENNGTPGDISDDIIIIEFNPGGTSTGTNYSASVSSGSLSPTSGVLGLATTFTLEPGTAGGGNITFTIVEDGNNCSFSFDITDPGPCSVNCTDTPQLSITGGGDFCLSDCPGNPLLFDLNITGGTPPYTIGFTVDMPAEDLTVTSWVVTGNAQINLCASNNPLSFSELPPTINLPESFAGSGGNLIIQTITDDLGCPGDILLPGLAPINFFDAPQTTDPGFTVCEAEAANYDLTIHNNIISPGATITWYDGNPALPGTNPINPPTDVNLTGIPALWVIADNGMCEAVQSVSFGIIPGPEANDPDIELCEGEATAFDLSILNTTVNGAATVTWYLGDPLNGGSLINNPPIVDLTASPDIWALVEGGTCDNSVQMSYQVTSSPEANTFIISVCGIAGMSYDLTQHNLHVNGSLPVVWYEGNPLVGGSVIADPTDVDLGTINSLFAFVDDGNCTGVAAIALLLGNPPNLQAIEINLCDGEANSADLTQYNSAIYTGTGTLEWYAGDPSNGGSIIPDPDQVDLTLISSLYVYIDENGCINQAEILFTIDLTPLLDVINPIDACETELLDLTLIDIDDLNNTGAGYAFYSMLPFTPANEINPPLITITTDQTFYILAISGICRDTLPVSIIASPLPTLALIELPCNPGSGTYSVEFITDAELIFSTAGNVFNNAGTTDSITGIPDGMDITISLINSFPGCESNIDISAPDCNCPVVAPPVALEDTVRICNDEVIPELSVTVQAGLIVNWYNQQSGGTLLLGDNTSFEPTLSQTANYYAEAVDQLTGCRSLRVAVRLEVFSRPALEDLSDILICGDDLINFDTLAPGVSNGVAGTGIWTDLDAGLPVSGIQQPADGALYSYIFTPLTGNCEAGDTMSFFRDVVPEFNLVNVLCDGGNLSYQVLFETNAEFITQSSGLLNPIAGTDSFLISEIPFDTDLNLQLISGGSGCDTTINVAAPDCDCPPLLLGNFQAICQDMGYYNLIFTESGAADGYWEIAMAPPGINPAVLTGTEFFGLGSDAGNYILHFISDDPLPGCPDTAIFTLTLVGLPQVDAGGEITVCPNEVINLNPVAQNLFQTASWVSTAPGSFLDPNNLETVFFPDWFEPTFPDSFLLIVTTATALPICPPEIDTIIVHVLQGGEFTLDNAGLSVCAGDVSSTDLDDFILTGAVNGLWFAEEGVSASISDSSTLDLTTLLPGSYTFFYTTYTQPVECELDTGSVTILIENCDCPSVALNPNTDPICNESATVDLTTYLITNEPGTWSISAAPPGISPAVISGTDFVTNGSDPGIYSLRFTLDNPVTNCPEFAEITLQVFALPVIDILSITCSPDKLTYDVYFYSAPGNVVVNTGTLNPQLDDHYITTGIPINQSLIITTFNGNGLCTSLQQVAPPDCSCNLEITPLPGIMMVCEGDTALLTAESTGASGQVTEYWITPTDSIPGVSVQLVMEGDYVFHAIDEAGCEDTQSVSLTHYADIIPEFTLSDPYCSDLDNGIIQVDTLLSGEAPWFISFNGSDFEEITSFPTVFTDLGPGTYTIDIQDGYGCSESYAFTLTMIPQGTLELGEDQTIDLGDSVFLQPVLSFMPDSFYWLPDTYINQPLFLESWITPLTDHLVTLFVIDENGCLYQDALFITVNIPPVDTITSDEIYIPNIFSPNGDGINDRFRPFSEEGIQRVMECNIFDRWGEIIFSQSDMDPLDPESGWEGNFGSREAQPGVYVYTLKLLLSTGEEVIKYGDITLVR